MRNGRPPSSPLLASSPAPQLRVRDCCSLRPLTCCTLPLLPPRAQLRPLLSCPRRGPYHLVQAHPRRTFFSGDLGTTLVDLGFGPRISLLLEPLPPRRKPGVPGGTSGRPPAGRQQQQAGHEAAAAEAAATAAAAAATAAGAAAAAESAVYVLQFKLTNGEMLRQVAFRRGRGIGSRQNERAGHEGFLVWGR